MVNLPIFIIVTLILIVVVSRVYKIWGFKGMHYERYFDRSECTEGEQVQLIEKVQNRKWLPMFWVRLESAIHANLKFATQQETRISSGDLVQNHRSLFSFMPYKQITRKHQVICSKRGAYRLSSATFSYGDPFGASTHSKQISLDLELLVFPKPLSASEMALPTHSWQGDVSVKRWIIEDPFLIKGVREYRTGDSLGKVNWKATARSGKLQVHQKDFTADYNLMIVVNFETDEKMWKEIEHPEPVEKAIRYAITVARLGISRGMNVGLICNGVETGKPDQRLCRVPSGAGKRQLRLINVALAKLQMKRSVPFDAMMEIEIAEKTTDTDYLILTPYIGDKMRKLCKQLEYNGNEVKIFPVPLQEETQDKGSEAVG